MEGSDEHANHKRRLSEGKHAPVVVAVATAHARCNGGGAGMETWRGGVGISPCRAPTRGAATPCVVASLIVGHNTAALLPGAGPWGGPLPEYWISRVDRGLKPGQVDTAQPVDGSGSHGWCGVALLWLQNSVL